MSKPTLSHLLKIPIGISTFRLLNQAQTQRSLLALMTIAAFVVVAYRPPPGRPSRRQTSFTGSAEVVAKAQSVSLETRLIV